MFIDVFIDSLRSYPTGTLLILIAIINIFTLFAIAIPKRDKNLQFAFYLSYSFFTLLWVISNAYFESRFLFEYGESMAKVMAISANITISFAMISFYGFTHLIRTSKRNLSRFAWSVVFFLIIVTLIFNLIPNLAVENVMIFPEMVTGAKYEIILSKWNFIYFSTGLIVLLVSFRNFILALKNAKDRIKNVRLYYILFGICLMYSAVIFSNIIMPQLFQNYDFVWISPSLSILHLLIIGYAIATKRFLDIRLLISKMLKFGAAFSLAIAIPFILVNGIIIGLPDISNLYLYFFTTALSVFVFCKMMKFFNSYTFYNYFGATNVEHLRYIAKELKRQKKVYAFVKECEEDLQKIFAVKNKKILPRIIVIDNRIKRKYPKIISYFKKNKNILVTEEIKFIESQKQKITPFLRELESLGGVCIPLFHASKGLVAFFVLGEKSYDHTYSKEEITALEDIGSYLSFVLTGIIYNSELEAEVTRKTIKLKSRIDEIKELLQQQSDFIAVTAHEFRTPLSIALFQLEDILSKKHKRRSVSQVTHDLEVVDESLDNLKNLTQKLFTVQQYDLKKVKLEKEKIDIKKYISGIYGDFLILFKEKSISLKLDDQLEKPVIINMDKQQMRQVLQNILTNAYKFTPEKGDVELSIQKKGADILIKISDSGKGIDSKFKKVVFDKFRSKEAGSGIGLGLYISKKIVELHRGKIWIEDSKLGGTTFCIQLRK